MAPKATLFQFQNNLPKLPVPTLDETLALYLQSVKPLVSDKEFVATTKAVEEFKKAGGMGEELQKRLLAHDASTKTSWLIDWWNSYAYMAYRDPVVINVNYFFAFNDDKKLINKPAARAATLVTGAMGFRRMVVTNELEPEYAKNAPLCSHQYRYLFNSTRIPKIPEDITRTSDPYKSNHLIVIRNNQFYYFDLVHSNGRQLSTAEIESQLNKIYKMAGNQSEAPVGALTTEDRDTWTKLRDELLAASPVNKQSLDIIETGAFVVCLDNTSPVTIDEVSRACWHGDGRNRFFDKSLQFIVFENGKAGFNGEHSMMDATPTTRLCDWILSRLAKNELDHGSPIVDSNLPAPKKLEFKLTPDLVASIGKAEKKFDDVVARHDLKAVVWDGYGKNLIKKFQVSPDAFAQMAIQLAYFKMYGKCSATYESAQTRKFAYGRTETCRTVCEESVAWVKAMEDPTVPITTKGEMGRKAINAQTKYMARAVEGKGVDRHLLGLRLVLKPNETKPEIFTDPTFAKSCHWNLSTSQISSEHYNGYGWGEVVPDGYGVAYMVKNDSLQFNLVSLNLRNDAFKHYFFEALREMRTVFEATIPPPKSKL
ncbi:Carnitine O-acetyltransferase mitochondrial [Dinochytrium kinnereticum]|nr:Carnitine O-acetyltransferase mitochondrial [Dinochytrium kinnereticum]